MKSITTAYTISEIIEMLARKDLQVNEEYQRSSDIWPLNARSYFIDTILEGFPFPKVTFYESYDKNKKKTRKEIVDGQQRIKSIVDFHNNEYSLSGDSKRFKGKRFSDLSEEEQERFLMFQVPVDNITQCESTEILEMFRRINAFTAPLTPAERRHAEFTGAFKWFVNELVDEYSPLLLEYKILTQKQCIRMADAEMICEMAIILDRGIVSKSASDLKAIYMKYDKIFKNADKHRGIIASFFEELRGPLSPLRNTFIMKHYVIHSLFCAMIHRRYGIPGGDDVMGIKYGAYYSDAKTSIHNLRALAEAHEMQEDSGKYAQFVKACLSTTSKRQQREDRAKAIYHALV